MIGSKQHYFLRLKLVILSFAWSGPQPATKTQSLAFAGLSNQTAAVFSIMRSAYLSPDSALRVCQAFVGVHSPVTTATKTIVFGLAYFSVTHPKAS